MNRFHLLCLAWACTCATWAPSTLAQDGAPAAPDPWNIRVMTWNIHHGEGMDAAVDLTRIANLIRAHEPDLVGLQEVDRGVQRTQRRDLPAELAALTGLKCVFSNNYHFGGGEYGNAILTKFQVATWTNTHFRMLSPVEQRGVLQARVRSTHGELVFLNTHLDAQVHDTERLHEARQLLELSRNYGESPIIMVGDFNATPLQEVCTLMRSRYLDAWSVAGHGDGSTVPVDSPRRRIDYVWLSQGHSWRIKSIKVLSSQASDHLPVVADLEFRP